MNHLKSFHVMMKCVNNNNIEFDRLEHQRMHEQHKGHDAMHAEMIIILLVTLILAQIALVEWKKRHYRSFSVSSWSICYEFLKL